MKKKLLILDLKKNYNIKRNNVDVIYLSYGDIHIVNSSRLDLEQYRNEKIKKEEQFVLYRFLPTLQNAQRE